MFVSWGWFRDFSGDFSRDFFFLFFLGILILSLGRKGALALCVFEGMFDRPQMVRLTGGLKGGNLEGGIVAAQGSVREGVGMDLFLGIFFLEGELF